MHVLFVHKNFPAQFGHIARYLIKDHGFQCSFVSELPPANVEGIRRIQYKVKGAATKETHYCSRTFENTVWHTHGVYEAMKAQKNLRPDLVLGHSGFGSTLMLADLYSCPIINFFEYYYHSKNSDLDFRTEFPPTELNILRSRCRNAMILLDLQTCSAGYCPTEWQRSLFPQEYQYKVDTIFDGVDRNFWYRRENTPRRVGNREIPAGTRIVTYCSRGFESMRGFDIFMKVAKRICEARKDVVFVCVGSDRVCYGGDLNYTKTKSYREWVLKQDKYDMDRFIFTGQIPPSQLADIFSMGDLHIYLTVPFVLSWSLMDSLSCGATVLASDTAPVREVIQHEKNGLLAGFYDIDGLTEQALRVLDDPPAFRKLGVAGINLIEEKYSLAKMLPKMLNLYERVVSGKGPKPK